MKINDKLKNLSFQVEENKVINDSDLKDNTSIYIFIQKMTLLVAPKKQ